MGAAYLATLRGTTVGLGAALAFGGLHVMYIRLLQQQRHVVKQRDQRMMIELGRRLKRKKAVPTDTNTPIGTHLILTGLLLTVNGVVLDIGLPAWLTARNERSRTVPSKPASSEGQQRWNGQNPRQAAWPWMVAQARGSDRRRPCP